VFVEGVSDDSAFVTFKKTKKAQTHAIIKILSLMKEISVMSLAP